MGSLVLGLTPCPAIVAADEGDVSDLSLSVSATEQSSDESTDGEKRRKRTRQDNATESPSSPEENDPAKRTRTRDEQELPARSRVEMTPDSEEYAIGDHVTVHVRIFNAVNVGSVPFHVVYDPRVLAFESGEEERFLSSDGRETAFFAAPTSSGDRVVVGLSRLGRGDGIAGTGELCVLHFTAIAPGDARLAFERAKIRDSSNGVVGASFEVRPVTVR